MENIFNLAKNSFIYYFKTSLGRMAEWSNAAVLKTAEPEMVPGVRIPLLPPF
tara:strand:+ start:18080 stop:18235 length:156 start_codon:yes stop_codon:yes gene_type:complete